MILILLILTAALLEFGAIIGGLALSLVIYSAFKRSMFDDTDIRNVALLLIAIAICLVGAVSVMPA